MRAITQLLDVQSTDPDEKRRSRLLSILLVGSIGLSLTGGLAVAALDAADWHPPSVIARLYVDVAALLGTALAVLLVNRYVSTRLACSLFVVAIIAIVALSDEPREVAGGRTLIAFTVPVVMASVLLPPFASFLAAGAVSLVIAAVAYYAGMTPNAFTVITFLGIGLVSWLSARTVQRALRDLRVLNVELDQRVRERTRELAEALGKNKAMVESIADGVIVFDMDGEAIFANPSIAHLTGQQVEEIIGCGIKDLLGDDVDQEDRETVAKLLRKGESPEPSVKFEWGDRTVSMSIAPVRVGAQERIGSVAVFRDFTKEAELDRMKSSFVSIASHELRTPLNAILGYTDMLQAGVYGKLSKKHHAILGRVVANIDHLLNLVNNLLDRAQIEAGTIHLHIGPFSPEKLVSDVVGVTGMAADSKELKLTTSVTSELPDELQGDKDRLHQILENLLTNAIKFTEKGEVAVRAYLHDNDHWALEVEDTGPGIPPEAHEYIFEPFRQVDSSITREFAGPGLGLSIVKQLTELMGGRIELQSELEQGSTFTVVLPLVPPAPSEEEQTPNA
jgi:PAS domain S-box-containing protein